MDADYNFYPIDSLVEHLASGRPVITPNHRLARRIKLAWGRHQLANGRRAWQTPDVLSLEHWWQACYRERRLAGDDLPLVLTPLQERALWLQAVQSSADIALLRPAVASELAAEAYRNLLLWQIDWREQAQQFSFGEDTRLFLDWADHFERAQGKLQRSTLPALVSDLAERCATQSILLAEFDELPPLYSQALACQAEEILHFRAGQESADCRLQACDTHRGELDAAARWALERHSQDHNLRIGILLPRLQAERRDMERTLQRVFKSDPRDPSSLPVNFSAGVPLADSGPVRSALALLGLPLRELELPELAHILHSRYRDRRELDLEQRAWLQLARDAVDPVTPAALRRSLDRAGGKDEKQPQLAALLLEAGQQRTLRAERPASEWPERFTALLAAFGWPGPGPLDSLEYQQVEQFHAILATLVELEPLRGNLDHAAALTALEQACANTTFQAQTPDAPIQVLGILEAAGLQFDEIWICGMAAGEWPPPPNPNPFIPRQLQRAAGMPHADASRELAYASRLLDHLRSSTRSMTASYARLEDDVVVPASALVADFPATPPVADYPWPEDWDDIHDGAELAIAPSGSAPPVSAAEAAELRGGSAIISDQAQCPFRAFAYHRLGAQPLPEAQPALNAAERGAILHEALQHLWKDIESSEQLQALNEAARSALVENSADTAIESFRQGRGRYHAAALLELERRRLHDLLQRWLDVELQRAAFVVSATEQRHEIRFGALAITLRIDRVDTLPSGRKLVIDYKSGDVKPQRWLGLRPEDPQLPLYTQLLEPDQVEGISFAVLRQSATEYRGLARSEQGPGIATDIAGATSKAGAEMEDWQTLQAHWTRVLALLAEEFLDGHAPVDPQDPRKTCTYCGLEALCRIR